MIVVKNKDGVVSMYSKKKFLDLPVSPNGPIISIVLFCSLVR